MATRDSIGIHVLRHLLMIMAGALGSSGAVLADPLTISRWTVDGGGAGFAQAGAIILGGTIGQPDAGRLPARDLEVDGGFWVPGAPLPVGVDEPGPGPAALPREARIHAIAPNPLIGAALVGFDLPDSREVEVQIFGVTGTLVRTLAAGRLPAGRHRLEWDGANARGQRVGAGLYLVRVRLGSLQRSQKLIVLR